MAVGQGQFHTWNDSVTTKRTIASLIHNIDPRDVPCISYFGINNEKKFRLENWPNPTYEWLEDTLRPRTSTVATAPATAATESVTVGAGMGIRFKKGDVWKVSTTGELVWVMGPAASDVVPIKRNWGGTAFANFTNTAILEYQFTARLEGAESDPSVWTTPTNPSNHLQIFHAELRVTGSEQDASTRYGITDQLQYQLEKWIGGSGAGNGKQGRAGDLMIDLENTFFHGKKVARADGVASAFGGFEALVTTNVSHNSGTPRALTQPMLEDQLQAIWEIGGMPDCLMVNGSLKRKINSFYKDSVRTERSEHTGGITIDKIETDFGNYDIMLNRRMPKDKVYITTRDKVGWMTARPWAVTPLAIGGDYTRKQVIGEFGFAVITEKAHGIIKDLLPT